MGPPVDRGASLDTFTGILGDSIRWPQANHSVLFGGGHSMRITLLLLYKFGLIGCRLCFQICTMAMVSKGKVNSSHLSVGNQAATIVYRFELTRKTCRRSYYFFPFTVIYWRLSSTKLTCTNARDCTFNTSFGI